MYAAVAIPYPAGYTELSREEELEARIQLCEKAIKTTAIEVKEQTIFGKDV